MEWSGVGNWFKTQVTLNNLFKLFLGQVVSFVLAIMGFTSSLIANLGVDAPITQASFTYFTLAVIYGSILLYRGQKLSIPWYWYLALGFVDVQGNYLYNKAFQFSSITSVTFLDCWTIVWVIILTYIFIGTRYSLLQLCGAALCVLGLGLVLFSDAGVRGGGGSNPLLGDALVISATLFFATSNVGEEICVKKKDSVEVVAMIGLFGMLCCIGTWKYTLFQLRNLRLRSMFELKSLESVTWSTNIIAAFIGYAFSSLMYYSLTPFVLKLSGSTMFNLSLLTYDMWAVVFRILFYRQQVGWIYFVAFALIVIGLVIYSTTEKDHVPTRLVEDGSHNAEYQSLYGENMGYGDECFAS